LAGPLTDKTGSVIVVEAESLEEAQDFAQNDPYMINGVFHEVSVHPFMQVFPREPNRTSRNQTRGNLVKREA